MNKWIKIVTFLIQNYDNISKKLIEYSTVTKLPLFKSNGINIITLKLQNRQKLKMIG